jgi:hypothetical protein
MTNKNKKVVKKYKAHPVSTSSGTEVDTSKALVDDLTYLIRNGKVSYSDVMHAVSTATTRETLYSMIEDEAQDGRIAGILKTISEDVVATNEEGFIYNITSDDPEIAKAVRQIINEFNIERDSYAWVYNMLKYGDIYVQIHKSNDKRNIARDEATQQGWLQEGIKLRVYSNDEYKNLYIEQVLNPNEMFELTSRGKTAFYLKTKQIKPIVVADDVYTNFSMYDLSTENEDTLIYPADYFVHGSVGANTSRAEEVINLSTDKDNAYRFRVHRGKSILYDSYPIWKKISLLEMSVTLSRLTKAAIMRIIQVEVGDMSKAKIQQLLADLKANVEQAYALNQGTSMAEYNSPKPYENFLYSVTHEGKGGITHEVICGDYDPKSLTDLDYFLNELYGYFGIPKQFMGETDDATGFNGGSSLSIISSRYGKSIKRYQKEFSEFITTLIDILLRNRHMNGYVGKYTLTMNAPVTQEDIDARAQKKEKVALANDIMGVLSDIEDPNDRLEVVTSILSEAITSPTTLQLLDNIIAKQRKVKEEPMKEEPQEETDAGEEDNFDINIPSSDTVEEPEGIDEDPGELIGLPTDEEEDKLPNGESLNIDLTNLNNRRK